MPGGKLDPVGGAVPLDSRFYIERPTDAEFREAIARQDSIVLVKGPRQVGKTSLLARGLQQAREAGARVVMTDFQKLSDSQLATTEALFFAIADAMAYIRPLPKLPSLELQTVINTAFQAIFTGQKAPKAAMEEVEGPVNQLLRG